MIIEFLGQDHQEANKITNMWFQEEGINYLLEEFYKHNIKVDMLKILINKTEIYLKEI